MTPMGVDAQLYAAAAASSDQSSRTRPLRDAATVLIKPTTVPLNSVAGENVTANGMKSGAVREGVCA